MLVRREKYDIFAWLIVLAMCVSYLGIYGLYNPNVKNYSAHSVASLGESRGIEAGNNDMLMVDNTAGLTVQTRNIKTGNMGESLEDTCGSCRSAAKFDSLCMYTYWQICGVGVQPQQAAPQIYTQKRWKKTSGICR